MSGVCLRHKCARLGRVVGYAPKAENSASALFVGMSKDAFAASSCSTTKHALQVAAPLPSTFAASSCSTTEQLSFTSRPTKAHMQHAQMQTHHTLAYVCVVRSGPDGQTHITYTYYVRTSNDRQTNTYLHIRITYVQATTDKQTHNYMYKPKRYTYMYIEAHQYVFLSYVHMRVLH